MGQVPEVDRYLQRLPAARRDALTTVRALIHEVAPHVQETMRYNMPTYDTDVPLCAFASQKNYISLYLDTDLVEKHREELAHLNVGKSCVRFKKLDDLPLETVRQILLETLARPRE